ncbi:MAG: glycosyltransferase [Deltaproteobacteria bacterium]|nr:MAG: glycosyltransferase [Deltaproteobacteria bacterium]
MELLFFIGDGLLQALAVYLLLNCLYLLFFAVAGHWPARRRPAPASAPTPRRMCVLMPVYQEDAVILESSRAALAHQYDGVAQVVVIADGLQPATVQAMQRQGIGVVEVHFERSTKGKALLHALSVLPAEAFDVAVVLDADNIMGHGLLNEVNAAFAAGYQHERAHRRGHGLEHERHFHSHIHFSPRSPASRAGSAASPHGRRRDSDREWDTTRRPRRHAPRGNGASLPR